MTNYKEMNARLNEMFGNLNALGKETALKRINDMLELPHYIYKDEEAEEKSRPIKKIVCLSDIDPDTITLLVLGSDKNGDPCLYVGCGEKGFHAYPVITANQIAAVNKFLKALDLGVTVEFKDYRQYANLIWQCGVLLTGGEYDE